LTVATYPGLIIDAYCEALSICCAGQGTYDQADCEETSIASEWVYYTNIGLLYAGLNSPNVTLDTATAQACITGMFNLGCGNNSASALVALAQQCSSALIPGLQAGQTGCQTSFDCPSGTYCGPILSLDGDSIPQVSADPANNSCLPLLAPGSACQDYAYSTECSSQGLPGGIEACLGNPMAGIPLTCQAALADGSSCGYADTGEQCASGVCDGLSVTCDESTPMTGYGGSDACTYSQF
jgi:hypothetical protein